MPPSSPPPVVHVGMKKEKKSPPTAASSTTLGAGLPAATELVVDGALISPSSSRRHRATTTADGGGGTLGGKTFVEKIYKLLDVPKYSSIISWNDGGTVVIIHDVDAFTSTIMPVYFERSKFGSFVRRMRRWGFSVTKQRSSSTLSAGEQSTAIEFCSEHFLRDKPNLCLLMRDERQVKKKFSFLDHNVKKVDASGVKNTSSNQGSSVGVCVHYPPSSSAGGGTVLPSSVNEQLTPVHYPPSLSDPQSLSIMNTANNLSSPMLTSPSHGDLNVAKHGGYLRNHSQEHSMPPLSPMNQFSVHPAMPMMNMIMTPPQPFHYGYGPAPPGLGFGQAPPSAFQYPAPDGYAPYPQQQQHQMMQQHQQQEMIHLNQQYPAPPTISGNTEAATDAAVTSSIPNGTVDDKDSSTAISSAALLSSCYEETTDFDLLPTSQKMHTNVPIHCQFDSERNYGV